MHRPGVSSGSVPAFRQNPSRHTRWTPPRPGATSYRTASRSGPLLMFVRDAANCGPNSLAHRPQRAVIGEPGHQQPSAGRHSGRAGSAYFSVQSVPPCRSMPPATRVVQNTGSMNRPSTRSPPVIHEAEEPFVVLVSSAPTTRRRPARSAASGHPSSGPRRLRAGDSCCCRMSRAVPARSHPAGHHWLIRVGVAAYATF